MIKQGLCTIMTGLVLATSTTQTFANVKIEKVEEVKVDSKSFLEIAQESQNNLALIDATDSNLRQEILANMHTQANASLRGLSVEQKQLEMKKIVDLIPNQDTQNAILERINFASPEEVQKIVLDPTVLAAATVGKTSNFAFEDSGSMIYGVVGAVVVVALVAALVYDIKHDSHYSYTAEFTIPDYEYCSESDLAREGYSRADMMDDARIACKLDAANPETCKPDGFSVNTDYGTRNGYEIKFCEIRARYESER